MKKIILATAVAATALLSACNDGAPKANLKTEADTLSYELGMAVSAPPDELGNYLAQTGSDSAYVDEFLKGIKDGVTAAEDKKKMAYYMGVQSGMQMKMQMFAQIESQIYGNDSTKKLSAKNFLAGFTSVVKDKSTLEVDGKVVDKEMAGKLLNQRIEEMSKARMAEEHAAEKKASEDFMAKMAKEAGVKRLDSGVLYKVLKEGDGAIPDEKATVEVLYEGKLVDGTIFDSTARLGGKPAEFPVGSVIKGWTSALTHMPVGSEWEIYVPWDLAYGEQGRGNIPPFAALIFKVQLVGIK